MPTEDRTDLPILLLYNLDHTWKVEEIADGFQDLTQLETDLSELGHPVKSVPIVNADLATPLSKFDPNEYIVFNWCEGIPGIPHSDAQVARALEALNFAYTGSPPQVLALSQDKQHIKNLLEKHSVPTPRWRVYESLQQDGWAHFPAIVKPSQEHCSLGVTPEAVVTTPQELHQRIAYILDKFQQPVLVEEFIHGPEFHVTLWGNDPAEVLPPVEIDFSELEDMRDHICAYDFKYKPGSLHYEKIYLVAAELSEEEQQTLEETSLAAYDAISCRDYARLDIRVRDGIFYVIDVNPNAGISLGGSVSYAADMAGYSYGAMGSHIVNLAASRHPTLGQD